MVTEEDTTDVLLAKIRTDIASWEDQGPLTSREHEASERMTRHFALLDAALKDGSPLPADWRRAPDVHWKCSLRVGGQCLNEATDLLVIRNSITGSIAVHPRCAEHPAASWVPLVKRTDPSAECLVLPLGGAR